MKPMLFNTEMVRAILAGRKSVTRRVIKEPWHIEDEDVSRVSGLAMHRGTNVTHMMPHPDQPYRPGDILYVRETWCDPSGTGYPFLYKADMPMHWDAENTETGVPVDLKAEDYTWHPSIHMPKEAARLFLRVKNVRVERLQESFFKPGVTVLACQAEGIDIGDQCWECIKNYGNPVCIDENDGDDETECECGILDDIRTEFADLWDSTIKPADRALYGWVADPWVWVIEFEQITKEDAEHGPAQV